MTKHSFIPGHCSSFVVICLYNSKWIILDNVRLKITTQREAMTLRSSLEADCCDCNETLAHTYEQNCYDTKNMTYKADTLMNNRI